jgi:ABC-type antimicrobial peptide transport system permease subunit
MIFVGIGVGLLFVLALGRLLQAQLYDVKSFDPTAIVITVLILCSAGLCAALIPAHRASSVNPIDALRVE